MVHSGSAHPMPTTPSASPHLTAPAPAPPLQAPLPLAQPLPNPTDESLTQTPDKLLTPAFTSNSVSIQSSITTSSQTLTLTSAKAQSTNWSPTLDQSGTHIPTPSEIIINGRSSGRKRTPKVCDCCGPNSKGHNVKTPPIRIAGGGGRARGRGRGMGRGRGRDVSEQQLIRIKNFEVTEEEVDDDRFRVAAVDHKGVKLGPTADLPMPFPLNEALIKECAAEEMVGIQKNEEVMEVHGGTVMRNWDGSARVLEMRLGGTRGRGASLGEFKRSDRKGVVSATGSSDMELRYFSVGRLISSKTEGQAESVSLQEEEEKAEMEQGENTCITVAASSPGNGDMINLCEAGTIGEGEEIGVKTDAGVTEHMSGEKTAESDNGAGSDAQLGCSEDSGLAMQVDQPPDRTVLVPLLEILSNGNSSPPTDQDHGSVSTGEQTFYPAVFTTPPQDAIVVDSTQHCWALKDHRLYCLPGTWEEVVNDNEEHGEGGELGSKGSDETKRCHSDRQLDGHTQDEESLQQLIEIVHEFLESFYVKYGSFIPLSESDVLEHLKKTGYWDLSNRLLDIPGEVRRYRAGLASAPVAGFMVTYNKQTLSLEDLSTLEEQNWLNDQIINMYGELIMATHQKVHFFNSFFHKQLVAKGYDGVKRWTKKVDLFSKQLLLVPIHLEIHWSLITVEIATKTISYYDSQGIVIRYNIDSIQKYLESEAREKKQTAYQKGWKMVSIKGIPQQKNDSDCGVFVLEYCRRLSVKQPMQFSQEDMPRIRKRIYKELCDCCLND
ncbi:uncharacterized protein LOC130109800 [Lampris incognitus]|uniref:uncharacterized protein LOC130109800 n=1 Tax=Lampris incognitus TaxID=2546036 RepID=UPI0024B5FC84|nr:uncharacterized protein LOC130109800 [Lampris incognitus]